MRINPRNIFSQTALGSVSYIEGSSSEESVIITENEFLDYIDRDGRWIGPKNVYIEGDLIIPAGNELISLSEGLHVGGDLDLEGFIGLAALPEDLRVDGDLHLNGRMELTSLPVGLYVGGNLNLMSCRGPISLPEGLHVGGDLNLYECTGLRFLPEGLHVGGNLNIEQCTGLTALPEDIYVGKNLDLCFCTSLTSLPNSITQLGTTRRGETRRIDLTGTGLSDQIIRNLQASNSPGIQFYYSQQAHEPSIPGFSCMKEAVEFWANGEKTDRHPLLQIENAQLPDVLDYLRRLTSTQEYKNLHTRKYLVERVMNVLVHMEKNVEIKRNVVNLMEMGVASCDDRIISALDEIELMIKIYQIEKSGLEEGKLRNLGKRFLRLEMVNQKAKDYAASLKFVDEIEVYLAFQTGLKERFQLPTKTSSMIFRNCADITDEQIQEIGDEIEKEFTVEKLEEFLSTWSPWIDYLRKNVIVPAFQDLPIDDQVELKEGSICPLRQDFPKNAVCYKGTIYDYKKFIAQWNISGKNPLNPSEKIDLAMLKRAKVSSDYSRPSKRRKL